MAREEKQESELVTDFVRGCGLRRSELEWLCVSDFYQRYPRGLVVPNWIHIDAMNGLPAHEVPFLNEYAWTIAEVCKGKDPLEEVFPALPDLDYEALRLFYGRSLFLIHYDLLGATGGMFTLLRGGPICEARPGVFRNQKMSQKIVTYLRSFL